MTSRTIGLVAVLVIALLALLYVARSQVPGAL